jgi:hypothetical protein
MPPPIGPQSTCPAPPGPGTTHTSGVSGSGGPNNDWTFAGSPHIVPNTISISGMLTIQPCVVVLLGPGVSINITATGTLNAAGTPGSPVSFLPQTPRTTWGTLGNFGGVLSLNHAILQFGGNPGAFNPAYTGTLVEQSSSSGGLHVDDVMVSLSASQGVYVNGAVSFDATSQNLVVVGSAGYAMHLNAGVVGSVPPGTYRGNNGHDAIAISGSGAGAVATSQTMHNRGVPYHVGSGQDGGRLDINSNVSGSVAVLTIEPGVTVLFPPDGVLHVDPQTVTNFAAPAPARGALVALGTRREPIVFTSDQGPASAPGNWLGITFGGATAPQTILQNVTVAFAGGASVSGSNSCPVMGRKGENSAAIRILGPPPGTFITYTQIDLSASDGIDRGWRANNLTDFTGPGAYNTFTRIAGCTQSVPRDLLGACPSNPIVCP